MDRSIVRIPVYIAFGVAVFLVALVMTFPDQRLKEIATVQIESKLGNKYNVEIEELDLWWLSGIELENVTLTERTNESDDLDEGSPGSASADEDGSGDDQKKADDGPPKDAPLEISIPRIAVGFSPLSSLANLSPTVGFLIDLGGGDIDGSYIHGSDMREVEVGIGDIELAKTPILESFLGVPVLGTLGGDIHLELDPKRPLVTGGKINLEGRQLMVDKATIHTDKLGPMAFIDVPPTSFGSLDANLVIDKPKGSRQPSVNFERFEFHDGRDVRGQVWGDLELGQSLATSQAKLKMRFQFDEKFIKTNDLSSVLQMSYFRDGKAKDWYGFVLWGRMGDPRFKGAPTAASGPKDAPENKAKTGKSKGAKKGGKPAGGKK
jgi:type II secretion system protein N